MSKLYNFAEDDPALHNKWIQIVKGLMLTPEELAQFAKEQLQFRESDCEKLIKEDVDVGAILMCKSKEELSELVGGLSKVTSLKLFVAFHPKPGLSIAFYSCHRLINIDAAQLIPTAATAPQGLLLCCF